VIPVGKGIATVRCQLVLFDLSSRTPQFTSIGLDVQSEQSRAGPLRRVNSSRRSETKCLKLMDDSRPCLVDNLAIHRRVPQKHGQAVLHRTNVMGTSNSYISASFCKVDEGWMMDEVVAGGDMANLAFALADAESRDTVSSAEYAP